MKQQAARGLGILGGGQLARMLAEAALRQGLRPVVLAQSEHDSATITGVELVMGELDDEAALSALVSRSAWVTIENEFLALPRIRAVLERRPAVRFRPDLSAIAVAQDKLAQKRLFARLGIPTADYEVLRSTSQPHDFEDLRARFPDGLVLKWSRFGYDGRGNLVVPSPAHADWQQAVAFCRAAEAAGAAIYAERLIDFVSELALVSTRGEGGAQAFFPLVVSRQEAGVCREVVAPAASFGVDPGLEQQAIEMLRAIGADLGMCGTFAVEFFLDRGGRLIANEMAPRVHNTGHYTLFGDEPSQFDLHVQAVTGQPLSTPAVRGPAVMRNLLGPRSIAPDTPCPAPVKPPPPGSCLYWYDKRMTSPGRKMGHVTGRAESAAQLTELLAAMAAYEGDFWTEVAGKGHSI